MPLLDARFLRAKDIHTAFSYRMRFRRPAALIFRRSKISFIRHKWLAAYRPIGASFRPQETFREPAISHDHASFAASGAHFDFADYR